MAMTLLLAAMLIVTRLQFPNLPNALTKSTSLFGSKKVQPKDIAVALSASFSPH
jgi:hypothetical protein